MKPPSLDGQANVRAPPNKRPPQRAALAVGERRGRYSGRPQALRTWVRRPAKLSCTSRWLVTQVRSALA